MRIFIIALLALIAVSSVVEAGGFQRSRSVQRSRGHVQQQNVERVIIKERVVQQPVVQKQIVRERVIVQDNGNGHCQQNLQRQFGY